MRTFLGLTWYFLLSRCSSFVVRQSFPSIRRKGVLVFAQPEDFAAGTIRAARPFRVASPEVADEKKVIEIKTFAPPPPRPIDELPIKPIKIPFASTPLRSEVEAERKRKHAEALKRELEAMEKRIVQRKEDALREARQKRAKMFEEEAALAEAEKRSVAADKDAEEKRLVAEKTDTVRNEEAARTAKEASIQADVEEEAAASRAQKAEEEAYEAQRRSEKAQQEEDEFRQKAKKDLEEARRQAQEYADKARAEREQAEVMSREANKGSKKNETKKEREMQEVRLDKEKLEAQEKAKAESQALAEQEVRAKKEDEAISVTASKQEITEEKEIPVSLEDAKTYSIEKADDLASSPASVRTETPVASPVATSFVRHTSSNVALAALPLAAIIGGAVSLRTNRLKRELEMHVELRELSKERIGELAQEENKRIQVFFWASIFSALAIAALQL